MPERRKSRKRHAGPPPETKRLSLLDLPSAADPRDELPTNPGIVIRPTTLIPIAAEPIPDASLSSLVEAARRSSSVPWTATTMPQRVAREAAAPDAVANLSIDYARPSTARPSTARPSSMPPPVQIPSEPPRRRSRRDGNPWLRTLGVIVLSSSVGALVASLISSAKSDLALSRRESDVASARGAALAPSCAPATPVHDPSSPAPVPASIAGKTADAPRITLDALPLQHARPAARGAETITLDGPSSDRPSQEQKPRPAEHRAATGGGRSSESKRARPAPPSEAIPEQPTRAALSQAIARAASAATSCDTGPQDGKVTVTFAPSGAVQSVSLVKGFGDADVNSCVLRAFGRARVPAFSGDPVLVRKSVAW